VSPKCLGIVTFVITTGLGQVKYRPDRGKGTGCPQCAGKVFDGLSIANQIAEERGWECRSKSYVNSITPLLWFCKTCEHEWAARLGNIMHGRKTGCPKCSRRIHHTIEECQCHARDKGGECKTKLRPEIEVRIKDRLEWECALGHIWSAPVYRVLLRDQWCPHPICKNLKSQALLGSILHTLLPHRKIEPEYHDFAWQETVKGCHISFDHYIPSLKAVVEGDGRQHFEPVQFGGISMKRARANLKNIQRLDRLKNRRVRTHPEDIAIFIRIPYTEPLTLENVRRILIENGVKVPPLNKASH
jgi:hypothetical protein